MSFENLRELKKKYKSKCFHYNEEKILLKNKDLYIPNIKQTIEGFFSL